MEQPSSRPHRLVKQGYLEKAAGLDKYLRFMVKGQDEAIDSVVRAFNKFHLGMIAPQRPIANLLFLGPTGTGKTHLVESLARYMFGSRKALVKIDCAEFQHSHEVAKLIGSPPGYLGHKDTEPILTQKKLDSFHNRDIKASIVLFDEVEKAHDSVWRLILGILDKAEMTTGHNDKVDFSRSFVFMTSNLGAQEMERLAEGGIGFAAEGAVHAALHDGGSLISTATAAAKKHFTPEFINRLDSMVVFKSLSKDMMAYVLDLELQAVKERLADSGVVCTINIDVSAKQHLIDKGFDPKYNARNVKRCIETELVDPLISVLPQFFPAEVIIRVSEENGELVFDSYET